MTKRWGGRVAALLVAAVLPVALGAAKCEEGQQHPSAPRVPQQPAPPRPAPATGRATVPQQPDPHAGDPQPSGRQERTITIQVGSVEKAYLPATVLITTIGTTPSNKDDILSSSDIATYTLTYDANGEGDVLIHVLLTMPAAGSTKSFCWIQAGGAGHDGPRYTLEGKHTLTCVLRIKRK